ncbi:MAG: hypothetical protein K8I04_06890 [Gammaproteobacteria bacterium]|nr:hypothetical protein [Gammaproteobacteria bacterium]
MSIFVDLNRVKIPDTARDIKRALDRAAYRKRRAPEPRTISVLDALIAVESTTQYDIERERLMRKRRQRNMIFAATRGCTPAQKKMVWAILKGLDTEQAAAYAGLASAAAVRALLCKIGRAVQSGQVSMTARQMPLALSAGAGGDV